MSDFTFSEIKVLMKSCEKKRLATRLDGTGAGAAEAAETQPASRRVISLITAMILRRGGFALVA